MNATQNRILAVLGPTASGKTGFAIRLAQDVGGEIVNCDSRQIYRELVIGTASPSDAERASAPHHLFNFLSPDKPFSAADYQKLACACIKEIWQRGKIPVLTGGTGFYYSAVADGLGEAGQSLALTEKLRALYAEKGLSYMVEMLAKLDKECVETIDTNNSRRVLRAIEVVTLTNKPFLQNKPVSPLEGAHFEPKVVIADREVLHHRIERRVEEMFKDGLEKEVRDLLKKYDRNAPGLSSIGYKEWFDYFDGKQSCEKVKELIIIHTRQYAKRQCTWFSKQPPKRQEISLNA